MLMKFENALQQEMRTKSTYVSRLKKATKENVLHKQYRAHRLLRFFEQESH